MVSKGMENLFSENTHLDLNNYFPNHGTFNSVVYFHKKFLAKQSRVFLNYLKPTENKACNTCAKKSQDMDTGELTDNKTKEKRDKANFIAKDFHLEKEKRKHKEIDESLLQQTKKFAKDIVPLTLPPSINGSHDIFYTVKSVKAKKKENTTIPKKKKGEYINAKSCVETYRKNTGFRESSTAIETTSHMSSLQELKMSELDYSLSEISNQPNRKKHHSNRANGNKSNQQETKLIASESLQALADGLNQSNNQYSGRNQIKLHVMTEHDKNMLTEGVHNAVVSAVRDCIEEISKGNGNGQDLNSVQKTVKYNSEKLENILDRLSNLEVGIGKIVKEQTYIKPIDKETRVLLRHNTRRKANASTLEQLGEDLLEQDMSEADDNIETYNSYDIRNNVDNLEPTNVQTVKPKSEAGNQGCGEDIPRAGTFDTKQEHTTRIPTRYCWTDVNARPNQRDLARL